MRVPQLPDDLDPATLADGDVPVYDKAIKRFVPRATKDTGWRNVSSLLYGVNASSELLLCRIGDIVFLDFRNIVPTADLSSTIYQLPAGFRPSSDVNWAQNTSLSSSAVRSAFVTANGVFGVWGPNTADNYSNVISYPCRQPWPTTLPGLPG